MARVEARRELDAGGVTDMQHSLLLYSCNARQKTIELVSRLFQRRGVLLEWLLL